MKFDHIGIFVSTLSDGRKYFNKFLNIKKYSNVIIEKDIKVKLQFLYDNKNIKYELVAPYGKINPITNSLLKKKNIINHLAYKVKKFDEKIKQLRSVKFIPISPIFKANAFKGSRVIFLISNLNFIIELIEDN